MMPTQMIPQLTTVLAVLVCLAALWRGDRPTRLIGGMVLIGWLLTPMARQAGGVVSVLALDLALLAGMVWVSARWRRLWIATAAACHLIATASHVARMLDPSLSGYVYITSLGLWSLGVIVLLLLAITVWRPVTPN